MKKLIHLLNPFFPSLLFALVIGLVLGIRTALVSTILKKNDITAFMIGLQATAGYAGIMIAAMPVDWLIKRIGIKKTLLFSCLLSASTLWVYGLVFQFDLWLLIAVLLGFGSAGLFIANESFILVATTDESASKVFS